MTDTPNTIYLVTGANRGLGLGLVKTLLARPNTTIIATVRSEEAAAGLRKDTDTANNTLHILTLDFTAAPDPATIATALAALPIAHIDVLLNNAGATAPMVPALRTTASALRAALETNTIAPLMVFQGAWPLLRKSRSPKAIWISSSVGSIADMEPLPGGAYGCSKAAQNWLTRAVALEGRKEGLVALAVHPGWVRTRAGAFVGEEWGLGLGPSDGVEESVEGVLRVVDGATLEGSGRFLTQKGAVLGW